MDKATGGQAPTGCNLCVLEAGLEGLAAPLLLEMLPRVYKVPGTLTPGCTYSRPITLSNPSRAPAHFSFHYPGVWLLRMRTCACVSVGKAASTSAHPGVWLLHMRTCVCVCWTSSIHLFAHPGVWLLRVRTCACVC